VSAHDDRGSRAGELAARRTAVAKLNATRAGERIPRSGDASRRRPTAAQLRDELTRLRLLRQLRAKLQADHAEAVIAVGRLMDTRDDLAAGLHLCTIAIAIAELEAVA